MTITGERVTTSEGGFNPTWQRHVAAYAVCAPFLGPGPVLDLGCGIGHSYRRLAPRRTVGLDLDAAVLAGQDRETVAADMRALPLEDADFDSVIAVHSIEHVLDPEPVLRECVRVLRPGGVAVFVTPNRLTFGVPDEIIDPYHYREYDPSQLHHALEPYFDHVDVHGIFGSPRYLAIVDAERAHLRSVLRRDPLRLRRLVPRRMRQRLYDRMLTRVRGGENPPAKEIAEGDFELRDSDVHQALDLVGVCRA